MPSSFAHAAAATCLLVFAVGCGGGGGESGGSADDAGGDKSSSGFAEQDAAAIAEAAKADMKELESLRYAGDIVSGDSSINLDVRADAEGDCSGTIGIGEGTAELLSTGGENWFRPDAAFWRQQAPDQAEAVIEAAGDKWVVDTDGSFAQFCDLQAFFDNIFSDGAGGDKYETAGTEEIDGQEVVLVEQTDEDGTSVGYVLVEGEHYLLKIERTDGDDQGAVEFSEFGEPVDVEAPTADQVVDLDAL